LRFSAVGATALGLVKVIFASPSSLVLAFAPFGMTANEM
jgi:hypothetical protein